MTAVWEDPRVARGSERMLAARTQRLRDGERPVGWKVAFGAAAAQDRLGISGPLVGFLTDASLLENGATVSVDGWIKPAVEPEIAVHLNADVWPGASPAEAAGAVGALGAAIEIVDFEPELVDVEQILAGDIYQRHVVLGPPDSTRAKGSAHGLQTVVSVDGAERAATDDPAGAGGELVGIVQHAADFLGALGERLRGGDVLIAGSVTPLVWAQAGQTVTVALRPLGELSVHFVA